jgi:carbonic anhydrase
VSDRDPEAQNAADWSYTGAGGPAHWGSLNPDYEPCSEGGEQSPIDLRDAERASPPKLAIDYSTSSLELEDSGHSVEAVPEPQGGIELRGTRYDLIQFHFHAPSEHTFDGRSLPLELHFVNEAENGSLAVLGVMAVEGAANAAYDELIAALPDSEGKAATVTGVDVAALLPPDAADAERWVYEGSLTTPPCSEGVSWSVFAKPIELSADQITAFTRLYDHNNRPVQPLGSRSLTLGS